MIGDKLVKQQYVSEAKARHKKASNKGPNSLADFYLKDAEADNDAKGRDLVQKTLARSKDPMERFFLTLTLSEYHLLFNDLEAARSAVASAGDMAKSEKNPEARKQMQGNIALMNSVIACVQALTGGR